MLLTVLSALAQTVTCDGVTVEAAEEAVRTAANAQERTDAWATLRCAQLAYNGTADELASQVALVHTETLRKKVDNAVLALKAAHATLAAATIEDAKSAAADDADAAKKAADEAVAELRAAEEELKRLRSLRSRSATTRMYITGQGTGALTGGDSASSELTGAANAAIGLRVMSGLDRMTVRLAVGTNGSMTSNRPSDFGKVVLNTDYSMASFGIDYLFTGVGSQGSSSFSSLARRAGAAEVHKLAFHPRASVGGGTWTRLGETGQVWTFDAYLPVAYEHDLGVLLQGQDLVLDVEFGPTMRAVAGDLVFARHALSDPDRTYGGSATDHVINDTVFLGPEARVALGLNDVEFFGRFTYLLPTSEVDVPLAASPGLTGWQFVAGVSVYGDLVKIYDSQSK